jgi:hypothetical protein
MSMKSPIQLFIALAVLLAAATVAAQVYKWVDKDGKVQFSDTPPPDAKTEAKKIDVKPASGSTAAATKSLAEKSKEFDKRKAAEAEKAKKAGEEEKTKAQNQEACETAKAYANDLQSGRPINRSNAQGERSFMSDEERAAELAKARSTMAEACK